MNRTYLILGAASGIAKAVSRSLAARGHALILAGRSREELELLAADVEARHSVSARVLIFDASRRDEVAGLLEASTCLNDGLLVDGVLLAYGVLFPQSATEADPDLLALTLEVNLVSAVLALQAFGNAFAARGSGVIVGISSVAGDRGRGSNFHYGSSKAGFSTFLDGLRHRLHSKGVQVCTVKPGFVATPMTVGLVNPNSPLCAKPEQVARDILRAIDRKKGQVYTLWPWRWIMWVVRSVPEFLFLKSKL